MVEDDDESNPRTFDRDLQSLLHQPGFRGVRGLLVGRFQRAFGMTPELLGTILSKPELASIPMVTEVDFGHTLPRLTLPIGGSVRVDAGEDGRARLTLLTH